MPPIAIFPFRKVKADPIVLLEFFDLTRDSSAGSGRGGFTAYGGGSGDVTHFFAQHLVLA